MNQSRRLHWHQQKMMRISMVAFAASIVLVLINMSPLTSLARIQLSEQELAHTSTVWGTLGVLRLMNGDVSSLTPEMRSKLGLSSRVVIIKESPVYDAIQRYLADASVRNFFVDDDQGTGIRSSVNDGQATLSTIAWSGKRSEQETQKQSDQEFRLDGILDEHKSAKTAELAEAIKPFSTTKEDAGFTSYSREQNGGRIIQYPALSDIAAYNQQSVPSLNGARAPKVAPNPWLNAVIKANPGLRGLIGYQYGFQLSAQQLRVCEPLLGNRVRQYMPYAKFIVFNPDQNPSSNHLRIRLNLSRADQGPYSLSSADKASSQPNRTLEIIGDSIIDPGSSLILPVEFGFQFISEKYIPKETDWINPVFIESTDGNSLQQIDLASTFIAEMKPDERQLPLSHHLIVGPTIANVQAMASKPLERQKVAILDMKQFIGMGSCPFLVVYDRGKDYWVDYGTVLVDRNNVSLQGDESRFIQRDISKIRIEEREDETSFIDSVSIAYSDDKGHLIVVNSQDSRLEHIDKQYAVLRKGERLEVGFGDVPRGVSDVTVRINGYYVPGSAFH